VALALVTALMLADLFRTLWRAHALRAQIARDQEAIAQARADIAQARPLRARREGLVLRLLHGRRAESGAWLGDVERAAARYHLALLAVHPVDSSRLKTPTGFVRHGAELRLRGEWPAVARWVHDLESMPGIVAVGRLWLEPARDVPGHALDARAVVEFYTPRDGGNGA